ncbi:hypothetical protein Avbf_18865 [Armadillidium vulgare]|nr:hypothetical protein Avbf_18865 [Armadillidium vulgare]
MKIFLSFVLLCTIVDNEVLVLNPSEDISDEDSDEDFGSLVRTKRQVANQAMDLALSHQDRNGNDRPVGQLHGRVDLNAVGRDARNYHAHGGLGAGAVVLRSRNNRHSLGVGTYADQHKRKIPGIQVDIDRDQTLEPGSDTDSDFLTN